MALQKIRISKLVKDRKTYPNWHTSSVYDLLVDKKKECAEVYYLTKGNRKISREFPSTIHLTSQFIYALGLLKGEGSNALGKSNYRRFTVTNSDPAVITFLLQGLADSGLLSFLNLKEGSFHLLHHTKPDEETIGYWSNQLLLPSTLFKTFDDKTKTTPYGVCHVYLSDVLLRRVVDLLHEKLMVVR